MEIYIGFTRDIVIEESRDSENLTIGFTELNGSFHGARTDIKIPARSYEMLEKEIVDRWLEKKKDDV